MSEKETSLKRQKRINFIVNIILGITITLITIAILYPMLFVVSTSFKTRGEFIKSPFSISFAHPENYSEAWTKGGFSVNAVNSLIVAVVAVVFQVATASLTIFAIGVLKYKGSNILFYLTLFSMFISGEVTTIPLFLLIREFGLIDSLWALLLPVMIAVGGTGICLGVTYIKNIPNDLHEAASLDGASILQTFFYIDLNLIRPVLAYIAITTFTATWNDFFWPFIVLPTNAAAQTLPIALINFQAQNNSMYGVLCAGLVIMSIPILLIYSFFSKYFLNGVAAGAVKG